MIKLARSYGTALAIWGVISLILIFTSREIISGRAGWDPDDQLRLVQIRDFLSGQSWWDNVQYRMNPPDGAPMHWSRLIELPLALIISLFTPIMGSAKAEMLAGTAVPLFCLGAIAFMLAESARKLAGYERGRTAAIIALLLAFTASAILMQTRPMRIDHHGWQIVMACLAFWSLFWNNRKWAGIVMGSALAIWLHISLEGAPLTAGFFMLLGWRWFFAKANGKRLLWTLISFVSASLLLFFSTQKSGLAAQQFCDTVSPVHIYAILSAAALLIPAIIMKPEHKYIRFSVVAIAGGVALAMIIFLAPECTKGAFATMDPVVHSYWYQNVKEGLPAWYQDADAAFTLFATPVIGMIALFMLPRGTSDDHAREHFNSMAFLCLYSALLSIFVFRTVTVATAFAIVPLALWITHIFARWRAENSAVKRIAMVAAMLALSLPSAIAGNIAKLSLSTQIDTKPVDEGTGKTAEDACEDVQSVGKLALLPDSIILAPFDIGPAILLTTRHKVIASSHHRNQKGMRDHIDMFRLPPEKARALIKKRGVTRIAACMDEAELDHYVRRNPNGLWAQLAAAKPPPWLEAEGVYGSGIMVWRVK